MGFGSTQNTTQTLPDVLRIRRTWQQNPIDSQSNASSNDDVIDMLITSRQVPNRRRRTIENELGMNESQFVSAEPVPNTNEDVEVIPRDEQPPPYSEIAQDAGTSNVWMSNRQILQQNALTGSIIQQGALGGPVIQRGTLGRAVIQAGVLGGPIGGPLIQQSAIGGSMIQSALGGAVIQSSTLGGAVIQPGAVISQSGTPVCGTNETSFSNVPIPMESVTLDRPNAPNVIRGFIINSALNVPGLNIVCDNNFQPERTVQGPVILNLELAGNEVQNNELPSYEEYVKSQND